MHTHLPSTTHIYTLCHSYSLLHALTYRDRRGHLWLTLLRGIKSLPLRSFASSNDDGKENAPPSSSSPLPLEGEEKEEEAQRLLLVLKERRRWLERALCWEAASDPLVPGGMYLMHWLDEEAGNRWRLFVVDG